MASASRLSESGRQLHDDFTGRNMRTKRLLGAAAAATLAAIAPLSATIAAAETANGVGTGTVSSTLLQVDIGDNGDVLSVRVLGDDGTSTIDPAHGSPVATTSLTPLTVTSATLPGLDVTSPTITSTSTGAEDRQEVAPGLPDIPAFSGSVSGVLSSVVDAAGARSGIDSTLSNISVAGGLLSVPSAAVTLGTDAATGKASATRSISIPALEVLNLAAVLEAAGVALDDLLLDDLVGLLAGLGIALPEIPDPAGVVTTVNAAIDEVQDLSGPLTADICATVDDVLGPIGGLAGTGVVGDVADTISDTIDNTTGGGTPGLPALPALPSVPSLLSTKAIDVSCDAVTGTVQDLVDQLQGVVAGVVSTVLDVLGQTSLLSVEGIEIGLVADATSSVESSVAEVTGTIGSVKVGALTVPGVSGLDLTSAADVLNGAAGTITDAVSSVLGLVNVQLADMVDVDVLTIEEIVGTDGDYTSATASVTALTAKLTPVGLLTGALDITGSAGDILDQTSTAVPALAPVMGQLEAALGGLDVLTAPTTITVGQITSSSAFRPVSASVPGSTTTIGSTPNGELPRTGNDAAIPAIAAVLVAGVALGIRRFVSAIAAL
jgi:hypothetical protein